METNNLYFHFRLQKEVVFLTIHFIELWFYNIIIAFCDLFSKTEISLSHSLLQHACLVMRLALSCFIIFRNKHISNKSIQHLFYPAKLVLQSANQITWFWDFGKVKLDPRRVFKEGSFLPVELGH